MSEVIVFADVEALLVPYLHDQLNLFGWPDVPVATRVPNPRPDEFVRVMVTGGTQRHIVADAPTVVVEAWALTEVRASELATLCRGLVYAIDTIGGVQFYRPETASRPQNLPDPDSNHVRYTATYSLSYRGAAL